MRAGRAAIAVVAGALALACALGGPAAASAQRAVPSIELEGTIDVATERWLDSALDDAERDGAPFAIVRLDTPGGLDTSMRAMVKRITDSSLPVVVYVAPDGARAASAGMFVTLAGDVAAMAPQTNIGSATPVQIGGSGQDEVLGRKIRNDAAAYARALADAHGRNADLAERAVRDAANVPARRALEEGLVDLVAADRAELLERLDGLEVPGPKDATLETDGVRVENRDMPLHYDALQLLVNPTIASLLVLIGIAGLALELFSPGAIVPGVVGGIALVLGLYGSAQLPVTVAGVVLLVLAVALIAAETQVPSGGILGAGGVAALVAGLLLLYDTDSPAIGVSIPAVVAAGVLFGGLTAFAAVKAAQARKRPVRGGGDALVGRRGTARTALDPDGRVMVDGAVWRAVADEDRPVARGTAVEVRAIEGLTLTVAAAPPGDDRDPNEGEEP